MKNIHAFPAAASSKISPRIGSNSTTVCASNLQKLYFPALTGFRAVAAWLVFFHHFNPFTRDTALGRLVYEGHMGVTVFFVLSGFLICVRYFNRTTFSRQWVGAYLQNRVARIYPLYLLLTCVTFIVIAFYPAYDYTGTWPTYSLKDKLLAVGLNLTFLRGLFDQFKFTGIPPGWTLTVEECFYLSAPLLLAGLARYTKLRLLAYAAGILGLGIVLVVLPTPFHPYGFFASFPFMLNNTFLGRCLEFLAGIYLGLYVLQKAIFRPDARPLYTLIGIVWISVCLAAMAWVDIPGLQTRVIFVERILLNNVLLAPGICSLFYGLITEHSLLRNVLSSKLFDLLGKSSYAFYLIHYGVLSRLLELYVTHNLAASFLITNLVAIGLYKCIEHPFQEMLAARK